MDDAMLLILDGHLKLVGRLSNDGNGTPFYSETITRSIADEDAELDVDTAASLKPFYTINGTINQKIWSHTLDQIYVPSGYQDSNLIKQGNSIAYQDPSNDRWYVMKMNTVQDSHDASGRGLKFATGTNICANDLSKKIPPAKTFKKMESTNILLHLLQNTGWSISQDSEIVGTSFDVEFDGTETAQSKLQELCSIYGFEIDAHVLFNNRGQIVQKVIDIKRKFGNDEGKTVFYGKNMQDVTREIVDTNLFTKLYVQDMNGEDSIKSANNNLNYIVDDEANDLYNPPMEGVERTYLEGTIQAQAVTSPQGLLDWARLQLNLFNHPRINYTVTVSPDFEAELGDTIRVIDYEMEPELTVVARVIKKITCFSDPTQNQVVLGEFATVKVITPSYIKELESRMDSRITEMIDQLRSGKRQAVVQLITPTGKTWSESDKSKKIIARVFTDGINITSYLSPAAFNWTKTDQKTGVHDLAWEEKHEDDGYEVDLAEGDKGNFVCTIEGRYLKDESEIQISHTSELLWDKKRADLPKDYWNADITGAFQYQWLDEKNQQLITSVAFDTGSTDQTGKTNVADTKYHRFDMKGNYIDSMIVQGGGHGSSFGARLVDGVPEIWTCSTDVYGNSYCLTKFKWQSNTIINRDNGLQVVAKMPGINGHYFRRISCDFEHGWVLSVMASGPVEVLKLEDLNAGKWNPIYSFKVQDFDFNPVANTEPDFNTMQSNALNFPYMFLNSGDVNGKDDRLLSCINVVTESEVFRIQNIPDMFGIQWTNNYLEPETIGYYANGGKPYVLQGFSTETTENGTTYLHRALFKTNITPRYDGNDKKIYKDTD